MRAKVSAGVPRPELKATKSPEEWEAKREDATWNLRMDREDYARY